MIYTWECNNHNCSIRVEVERKLAQRDKTPGECPNWREHIRTIDQSLPFDDQVGWKKIITVTPVMFEQAYDTGVLERIHRHPNL